MISIVMSCYNSEKTVERAIRSILNQTYQDFEIIIVDDCSTDNSVQVIESIKDSRIRLFKHEVNKGAGLARRTAIENIKGEWMTFLDSDDYYKPDCLETLLANSEGVDIVAPGYIAVEGNTEIVKIPDRVIQSGGEKFKHNKQDTKRFMNMMLIKSSLWDKVTYSSRRFIEDTPTLVQILYYADKILLLDYAGYYYVQNPTSLIHTSNEIKDAIYLALCAKDVWLFFKDKIDNVPLDSFWEQYNKIPHNIDCEEVLELHNFVKELNKERRLS